MFAVMKDFLVYIYNYLERGGFFLFDIKYVITNKMVSDIGCCFKFVSGDKVCRGGVFDSILGYDMHNNSELAVRSTSDALRLINACERALLPAFDHAWTIDGLDKLLNGDADPRYRDYFHNFVYKPQCIIVARLAGSPRFESLVDELGVETGWYGNAMVWKEEWPKLVKYLREEVKPIV